LQFAAGREGFLHRVLIPMFREFREHPGLFAWEIANEPEWAIREFHRQPAAKRILIRGDLNPEWRDRSVTRAQWSACLIKPVDMVRLRLEIRSAIGP